jgi:hypothetical protein
MMCSEDKHKICVNPNVVFEVNILYDVVMRNFRERWVVTKSAVFVDHLCSHHQHAN